MRYFVECSFLVCLAANGVIAAVMFPLNKTPNVETTLSFAINPLINDVTILQSPNPNGEKTGTNTPATIAKMLCAESSTIFNCRSNLCKNHTTIVATKITENAFCKKSFAFSHNNCATFFTPGSL